MLEITRTMKLRLHTDIGIQILFEDLTKRYASACNEISGYIFDNSCFNLKFTSLQKALYSDLRTEYGLKSQLALSAIKTVIARYKTVKEQLLQNPYKYKDDNDRWKYITRTLEWLQKPIHFSRPQADLVKNRDYSFVSNGEKLSINTLGKRVKVAFDLPDCFKEYFDGTWKLGTAKLVSLNNEWYLHVPATKTIPDEFDPQKPSHVVGIDTGLRFITTTYDERGKCAFRNGKEILNKRNKFQQCRSELQSRGTKSAKRKLKAISGRENRWMTDVNHQISKALVTQYGKNTLFAIEDMTGISFSEKNLHSRKKDQRRELRSWAFYQLEQFLSYKALESGSMLIKVNAYYTSQRCPKCGRIHKENRKRNIHEYICDACGYRSNDDRVGAMNIHTLATMYVSGDDNPQFKVRKKN